MLFTQSDPLTLPHISDCAGKTEAWYRGDNEDRYDKNVADGQSLPYNKTDIVYDWNSMGYRCPEFKSKSDNIRICLYGDSCMEGYGLPIQDSPGAQLAKHWNHHIGDSSPEVYNLAKASASNDFISQLVYSSVPVLKPDLVVIYWTYVSRREIYTEDGNSLSFLRNWSNLSIPAPAKYNGVFEAQATLGNWRSNVNNFLRNYMFVKYFLRAHNIPYVWSSVNDNWHKNKQQYFDDFDRDHYVDCGLEHYGTDVARDLMHPGPETIDTITERMVEHYCKNFI